MSLTAGVASVTSVCVCVCVVLVGGLSVAVEGPSKAEIHCADNADNTYTVTYYPQLAGTYNISVQFAGKHIVGSPFSAKIVAAGAFHTHTLARTHARTHTHTHT